MTSLTIWHYCLLSGDSCNIGIIARHPTFLPYIKHHLTEEKVADFYQYFPSRFFCTSVFQSFSIFTLWVFTYYVGIISAQKLLTKCWWNWLKVADFFEHYLDKDKGKVRRFDVPGIHAVNFLLEHSLGGGGIASLRPDPLGKSYAQMLLSFPLDKMPCLEDIKDSHFHWRITFT